MLKKLIVRLSFLLLIMLSGAAGFTQSLYFKHFTTNDGLSHNTVTSIFQDKKGFLWIGTKGGLNRFDGSTFRRFKNKHQEFGNIGDDLIQCICEDVYGNLWLGTGRGLLKFNPETEDFEELNTTASGNISSIVTDGKQSIWFVSSGRLYQYNLTTRGLTDLHITANCIGIDKQLVLWLGTEEGTLKRYNPNTKSQAEFRVIDEKVPVNARRIDKVLPTDEGIILIGTIKLGLMSYDTRLNKPKALLTRNPDHTDITIRDILSAGDHQFWLATESGLFIYNLKTNTAVNFKKDQDDPYAINDNAIYSFCQDTQGGIWVGTYFGGLNYYTAKNSRFKKYYHTEGKNAIAGNAISAICEDSKSNIWLGTEDAGISKINLRTGDIRNYTSNGKINGLGYPNVHSLVIKDNKLYIGLFHHGLEVMDVNSGLVTDKFEQLGGRTGENRSNFVLCLMQSKAGKIYLGTIDMQSGLYLFDEQRKTFTKINKANDSNPVFAIAEDNQGVMWLGSENKGIFGYNPFTNKSVHIRLAASTKAGAALEEPTVHDIYESSDHCLWLATEGGGVIRLSQDHKSLTRYTTHNGLPSNYVYRILEDSEKNVWMSSINGLVKLNQRTGKMTTYMQENGLLTDQFNYGAAFKTKDGTMYFGTVKGLVSFNPHDFASTVKTPPVYITNIEVNNEALAPVSHAEPFHRSIVYADSITLGHQQNNLNLEFAALDYTAPKAITYSYILHGFSSDWTHLDKNRKVYFTGLPPGHYTFEVKAQSNIGEWISSGKKIYIEIRPPFYKTQAAFLAYILFTCLLITYIIFTYRNYLNNKHQRKLELFEYEKAQELYQVKINFFTNIAHEIKTPLTLIKLPVDKMLNMPGFHEHVRENILMIKKNTERLIELTNQLLDFRRIEGQKPGLTFVKANLNNLLQDAYNDFQLLAHEKGLRYKLDLPRYITLHASLDVEAFKKILVNLLSNAVKYAESEVTVRILPINSEDELFSIEFKNDGELIPAKFHQKIFEPFFRIHEKEQGSGIGLSFALSLTLMHKGTLTLDTTNQFNIFKLSLPLYQDTEVSLPPTEPDNADMPTIPDDAEPAHAPGMPAVLLVEDNPDILKQIELELKNDYSVYKAGNGSDALKLLEKQSVQLIVSDIMMPVMDGIELCKRVKTDFAYSHIPVILLTAKTSVDAKIEGLSTGADAYIEKPFSMPFLYAQIRSLLTNRKLVKEHLARSPLSQIKSVAYSKADLDFLETLSAIINNRLTDIDLNVETLSELMHMSRPTLYRKIKALTDITPSEFINLLRLKRSAELLAEGQYKINQVAYIVGYTSPANFTRDFQKQFGLTPSAYIKR
ncbi:response regulator [Mucilaginibacter sp. Bleaf8]|uniref:hybrid sensor histidine kinase/response regulator transcription factor n=1 Tax=Mucilaginibacter sp. Bleaf8 TaxID=2834430 RepID=UPI001BD0CA7E|nr:hybrid sensor histidine kinase/response regulator transcription factor [Mucilaginibacter sp. Bleaf8]MBS7566763.1 response regulator [Mucilaginibacter sp. Bleaf8]